MDKALESLISLYTISDKTDYENSLKEIIQHIALLGLWRSKFFHHAAFYGGSALRIFHGLRRFSEDLDFSLLESSDTFNLDPHLEAIKKELEGFGFQMTVLKKDKLQKSQIESAFIKGNTIKNLILIEAPESFTGSLHANKKLAIKLEVDTNPPGKASYEVKNLLIPIPFQVQLFSKADLFAGKLHAVICRQWRTRIKGRDFYDFLWYIGNRIPCHLDHLKERMVQTGHWRSQKTLLPADVIQMLKNRFEDIDFDIAKKDISPFIRDPQELDLWSPEFFIETLASIEFC